MYLLTLKLGLFFLNSGESNIEKCHHGFWTVQLLQDGEMGPRSLLIVFHIVHSISFFRDSQEAQLALQLLVLLTGGFQSLVGLLQFLVGHLQSHLALYPWCCSCSRSRVCIRGCW
jgi:hypothetical protein